MKEDPIEINKNLVDFKNDRKDNKLMWELLPTGSIEQIVEILTYGAQKYEPESWRRLYDAENRYYAAAMRHIIAWRQGEIKDKESGLNHLAHAMCNLMFLIELQNE